MITEKAESIQDPRFSGPQIRSSWVQCPKGERRPAPRPLATRPRLTTVLFPQLFRYSFLAQYTIYNIATGDLSPLWPGESPPPPAHSPGPLGPDGPPGPPGAGLAPGPPFLLDAAWTGRGSALLMVYDYDIYYKPSANASRAYRITTTAVPGVICNGVPDWLYEGKTRPEAARNAAFPTATC